MYCKHCGQYMDDNAQFCPSCGASQAQERPASQVHSAQPAASVGIVEATRMFFTKYTDFSTRSRRSEYWWAVLSIALINVLITIVAGYVDFLGWLPQIWSLAILIPGIALTVRRLHDAGHKGTYYLWILLPLAGPIILLVQCCKDSVPDNQWGPNPKR